MRLSLFFTIIPQIMSQIIFNISAAPFSSQCVNNMISVFGLNLFIKGSINGIPFSLPMGELGLPVIDMDWFVNGTPANQLMVQQSFNVDGSVTNGNRWSYQLRDDQPNIGAGIITLGPCVMPPPPQPRITVSFSTTSFINGVGFPSLNLPPASGIPIIINNLAPQNNNVIPTTLSSTSSTATSSTATTILPTTTTTTTTTMLRKNQIIFTFSSTRFNKQCVNNKLSVFGLNMFIRGSVNGVAFTMPMTEIGLPIMNMNWFVNGSPANPLVVLQTFNVDGSTINGGNTWTFQLKNDQPTIGAGTITLGPCIQRGIYTITVTLSTNSFINGLGVPNLGIPIASGVPVIVNNITP